jgi:hypothetical protein
MNKQVKTKVKMIKITELQIRELCKIKKPVILVLTGSYAR